MSRDHSHLFPDLTPLQQDLVYELRQNSARAVMLHQLISEKLGLNATDHKCLDFLNRTGPVTAGQLAELTGLTTGAVTNVIDRLEQAGYVVRDKDPKRSAARRSQTCRRQLVPNLSPVRVDHAVDASDPFAVR
ncbi:MarR family transcriptional regulator [Paenibacillus sp. JTLBN-2024]